jgi:hypothetical protein
MAADAGEAIPPARMMPAAPAVIAPFSDFFMIAPRFCGDE